MTDMKYQSKEEGKDQESMQSITTPGHHMGKWQKHKKTSLTREPRGQPFPSRWPSLILSETRDCPGKSG